MLDGTNDPWPRWLDNGQLLLRGPLDPASIDFWPKANHHVLWGWKRDEEKRSRLVYYSAQLELAREGVAATSHYFAYKHRCEIGTARELHRRLEMAADRFKAHVPVRALSLDKSLKDGLATIRFELGTPSEADSDKVRRLSLRRARKSIDQPRLPENASLESLASLAPFDLYAGSGVSYEAGLPTLCHMHDVFCLDDRANSRFTIGQSDHLPSWFADEPEMTIARFCSLHVKALSASPSPAMSVIAEMSQRGVIPHVMSDNVDNMLCKVDVPFVRTRGSGVFNERFPAKFQTRTLVVIGVAADRRQIVRQARANRMRIVVINPCFEVSPNVQHLNYVKSKDEFFKMTADAFFRHMAG